VTNCHQLIQSNDHTPIQPELDTNILRVNNLYTFGIERLFTVYNINNNTHAREFDKPVCTADSVNNFSCTEKSYSSEISQSTDSEKQDSSYADIAFGSLTKPTQSAFIATKYLENNYLP
jgi:hypothetical protein